LITCALPCSADLVCSAAPHCGYARRPGVQNGPQQDGSAATGDRYHQAEGLTHLGDAYRAVGDTATARAAWQQALDILEELDHPDVEGVRSRLVPGES
jgi:hypothetical protein